MPRLKKGSVPTYRLHRSSGQAIVTIDGQDYYLGKHGTPASRQKYAGLIRAWEKRKVEQPSTIPVGPLTPDDRPTVNDIVLAHLRHVKDYYKPGEDGQRREAGCVADALDVAQQLYGRELADAFGPKKLKEVRKAMIERGWCRQYVNHQIGRVKRMFSWAVEEELIPGSVYHALLSVKGLKKGKLSVREGKKVRPAPIMIVRPVVNKAHPVLAAMIRFQFHTGCRSGELCALKPEHLDRTGKVWIYTVPAEANKTDHHDQERKVYIGPRAQKGLQPWLDIPADQYVFSPVRAETLRQAARRANRKTPVYPSHLLHLDKKRAAEPRRPKRDHYDTASYRRAVKYACKKAKVESWHPHRLRHSAATRFRRKYGIEVARILLGHKKIGVTELYAERDLKKAQRVARLVG